MVVEVAIISIILCPLFIGIILGTGTQAKASPAARGPDSRPEALAPRPGPAMPRSLVQKMLPIGMLIKFPDPGASASWSRAGGLATLSTICLDPYLSYFFKTFSRSCPLAPPSSGPFSLGPRSEKGEERSSVGLLSFPLSQGWRRERAEAVFLAEDAANISPEHFSGAVAPA